MATPKGVIDAYIRRIERGDITLDDIKNAQTRKDVSAAIEKAKS